MEVFTSLIRTKPQIIEPETYTAIKFDGESADALNWHPETDLSNQRSALIIPTLDGPRVGMLWAKIGWASIGPDIHTSTAPTKFGAKFVRDPFTDEADQTAATHWAPVPFGQNHTFMWPGVIRDRQPLALFVMHDASGPLKTATVEIKLWIP